MAIDTKGEVVLAVEQFKFKDVSPRILEDAIHPSPPLSLKSAQSPSMDSTDTIQTPKEEPVLPGKKQPRIIRQIRHTFLNVYRRIFGVVFIANLIGLIVFLAKHHDDIYSHLPDVATAASANIFVAAIVRVDYVANAMHIICRGLRPTAPLRLRRMLTKVYEYGGMHSGCAVSGTMWFLLLTVLLSISFAKGTIHSPAALTITYLLLVLFLVIVICAYPKLRFRTHNAFEYTHRFAGWTSIALFWIDIVLLADDFRQQAGGTPPASLGMTLIKLPAFWFLVVISIHIVLPWLRLRKVEFTPERLSEHAIRLHFTKKMPAFSGLAIAETPMGEWHPFACFPEGDSQGKSNSLVISHAGDWTRRTIDNPRSHYYIKGLPRTGVLGMALLFTRVVVVTTGSGIGPVLSYLSSPSRTGHCRILWSAPRPLHTFGRQICDKVQAVDSEALVWDTREKGRPDMLKLTLALYAEFKAEAVFVISNPMLTRKLVYGCESRGVPAFGPIWDS